jgi:glycosyltransferase involved in cell wall biosynthesis
MEVRFNWYWPFSRPEEIEWAHGTARRGESIVVDVIDRPEAPSPGQDGSVTVARSLPDVDRSATSPVRWATSRARTYRDRAETRRDRWDDEEFDLVHLHYLNRFTDAFASLPHPLVMSVHDVMPHQLRLGRQLERRLLGRLYSRADALVVHHRVLADELVHRFDVPHGRIHVVPHQVFPVGEAPLAFPEGAPSLLFFGAFRANKGMESLGPLMKELVHDDVRLVIAGRGDPALEDLARRLAEEDSRVHVEIGHVTLERKRQLFAESALVLMPYSAFESQSGVLHDAYGHARPVVVTEVGALGETVRADATGVVVSKRSPQKLAQAVREVLSSGQWEQFSQAAQAIATKRSPAATGARLREVYDSVLQ